MNHFTGAVIVASFGLIFNQPVLVALALILAIWGTVDYLGKNDDESDD